MLVYASGIVGISGDVIRRPNCVPGNGWKGAALSSTNLQHSPQGIQLQ